METHHWHVEWALANRIDPDKIIADFPALGAADKPHLRQWLDSEGNMLVLCEAHHRHGLYGIHMIKYPAWAPQRGSLTARTSQEATMCDCSNVWTCTAAPPTTFTTPWVNVELLKRAQTLAICKRSHTHSTPHKKWEGRSNVTTIGWFSTDFTSNPVEDKDKTLLAGRPVYQPGKSIVN